MDWDGVIERNREALKRIVAMLVAMAGLGQSAIGSRQSESEPAAEGPTVPDCLLPTADCLDSPTAECRPTLPRHLHRAILRLLRPAESAVRRLIIVMARGLVVTLPPSRPRKARPTPLAPVLRSLGIAVVTSGFAPAAVPKRAAAGPRVPILPLIDPLKSFAPRRRYVPAHAAPRIMRLDLEAPYRPLPAPPSPDDPLDATGITRRLHALGTALDDLPGQAKRFARWRARKQAGRTRRNWPLRPGRAPGQLKEERRRQDVHDILADLHYFAREVLESPDTS